MSLLISSASPVEFWPTDCETHNERTVCGVHLKPWCAPWECDDEIKVPGVDLTSDELYELAVLDANGDEIERIEFVQQELTYQQEVSDELEDFENTGPSGAGYVDWDISSAPTITLPDGPIFTGIFSRRLTSPQDFIFEPGVLYKFDINITKNDILTHFPNLQVSVLDESGNILNGYGIALEATAGTFDVSAIFLVPAGSIKYSFSINRTGLGGSTELILTINSFSISQVVYSHLASFVPSDYDICDEGVSLKIYNITGSPDTEVYHSDGLDIKTDHPCSKLISYRHERNIAGIIYTEGSPELTLYVRVLAMMRIERFPQEDLSIELTTGVDTISSSITDQMLFEAGYSPYYFHKKLIMIFMHKYVYIDGKYWKKVEKYEIIEGDRMQDLKTGEIFLTEADFTFRLNS